MILSACEKIMREEMEKILKREFRKHALNTRDRLD
jgi:hypothetical protein